MRCNKYTRACVLYNEYFNIYFAGTTSTHHVWCCKKKRKRARTEGGEYNEKVTLASIENFAPSSWETIFRTLLLYTCLIISKKSIVMIRIGEIVSKHDPFLPFYNLKVAMSRRRFSRVRHFFRTLWRVLMCILVVNKQHPVNRVSCRSLTRK